MYTGKEEREGDVGENERERNVAEGKLKGMK